MAMKVKRKEFQEWFERILLINQMFDSTASRHCADRLLKMLRSMKVWEEEDRWY